MFKRAPQPPVNPALRDREHHACGPGFIACAVGVLLAFYGAWNLTGIATVDGPPASEIQLNRAFTASGLQYASKVTPPAPPKLDNPATAAAALDRWARQQAAAKPPTWKVRVDTSATTPCPT